MKNCVYTLKINGKEIKIKNETDLDNMLLDNFQSFLKEVKNSNTLFSFDKTTLDVLDSAQEEAKERLKEVRAKALAEYLNIDDNISYTDGAISVLDWIANVELANPINRDDYRKKKVSDIRAENPTITDEQANKEIDKEFASWSYSQQLGRGLHFVTDIIFNTKVKLTPSKARIKLNTSWTKGFAKDATLKGMTDEALESFIQQMTDLKFQLNTPDVEKIYTEYVIDGAVDSNTTVRGKVDIVVVKKDGSVHIYDVKVSKDKMDNWDIDKKNFMRFQLETYRRLLHNKGINSNKILTSVIPIEINIDKSGISEENEELKIEDNAEIVSSVSVYNPENVSIRNNFKLSKKFNDAFPVNSITELNTSKLKETVSSTLSKYFPVECLNGNKFSNVAKQTLIEKTKRNSEGKFQFYDSIGNKYEIFNTEEELSVFLDDYLSTIDQRISEQVSEIKQSFKEALEIVNRSSDEYISTNFLFPNLRNAEHQSYINTLFSKYTYEKGWKVVDNDDLIDMGVIMLVNDRSKKVDFVSMTGLDPSMQVKLPKGRSLLGSFYADQSIETDSYILPATRGNIELIKLLEIADNILQGDLKDYEVDELAVVNVDAKKALKPNSLDKVLYNYNMLRRKTGVNNTSLVLLDPLIKFYQVYNEIQTGISSLKSATRLSNAIRGKIKEVPKPSTDLTPEERNSQLKQLYNLLEDLKNKFFFYEGGYKPNETLESALYAEVAKAIINLSGIEVDPYNAPKLAEWFGDIWKDGGLNRQFLNSTKLNTSDTIELFKPIKKALDSTRYNIRSEYFNYKMAVVDRYKKFKASNGLTSNKFFNMSEYDYKNLFDTSENGKKYFLLKDPKSDTSLTPAQREFLEFYLKDINSLRFPGQSEEALRKSGQWLMAGIMKASTASRIANSKNIISLSRAVNANVTDELINRKNIVEESSIKSYTELNDDVMMEMYNIFATSNTLEARAQLVDKARKDKGRFDDPMSIFETNLEIVGDTMHLAYIRENEYNKILPAIQANLTILRLASFISSDKDIDKTIQFITDHIKTTVFNESLISSENKQLYAIMSHAKRWASGAILGFNWKSGIKETAVSFFTLYTRAIANSAFDKDKIGLKDMLSAYTTVWGDALHQVTTVTKLEALNMVFGISNMSEDELVSRLNYFQGDPLRFNGNLFWCNRAPDYLNRMTILVGYMKKYGCYDSYEFKDNQLIYNWKKDNRFNVYAKYKDSENSVPKNLLREFQYQRALYEAMMNRFISQGYQITDSNGVRRAITKEDNLPQAFTDLEIAGIKQEADTLFGYMDNDNKSEVFKTGIFTIIGHFKTYLTAKKNQWFLTRGTYAGGHFSQARNENNELLYMKYDENGKLLEITTEVTDHPYIKWEGSVTEGIFWSVLDLIYNPARAIFDPTYRDKATAAWRDPIKKRNALIAGQELFLYWLIQYLLKLALGDTKVGELSPSQRTFIGMARDVSNELNVKKVLSGATEFNAPAINFTENVLSDIEDVFDGKLNIAKVFIDNFGAIRPLKYSLYDYFPNPDYIHTAAKDLF